VAKYKCLTEFFDFSENAVSGHQKPLEDLHRLTLEVRGLKFAQIANTIFVDVIRNLTQ
jgi:hypothetical protein